VRPDPNDTEIRDFVLASDQPTYSLIAKMVLVEFGPSRAWPVALIRAVRSLKVRPGPRHQYCDDPALAAFIADRADLVALDTLLEQGRARFGKDGFPSRSQLHRLVLESRQEAVREARAITGQQVR
jgi:hypothetical protein